MALRVSMETDLDKETTSLSKIDDQSTSDVVVRLRTQEGRDTRFYCHSHILTEKSRYFAERLSENWPTCQILDSRDCVEVYCQESEFDHHVAALRLLYAVTDGLDHDPWHGVRNALGILQVAVKLGCEQMVSACVDYLEAVPWEEAEEEEILKVIPSLGSEVEPILARLQPVDPTAIRDIFLSTIRFATSSPPPSMIDLKCSAQDQLEYMLAEDDDAPLLTADDELKSEVRERTRILLSRFYGLLDAILSQPKEAIFEAEMLQHLLPLLSDLAWACLILAKMEIMRDFVHSWVETSEKIVKAVQDTTSKPEMLDITVKVLLVASKVLEAIAYGSVILPTAKRLHMVKVWLPLVRMTKPLMKPASEELKMDTDQWQSLESAFVSMVLALPSGDQAEILNEWLGSEHIQYPDLTEAFELWCYRSKVAKRRLSMLGNLTSVTN